MPSSSQTHECPNNSCTKQVQFMYLACRNHWRKVSPELRAKVYKLWRVAPMSDEYMKAREEAIAQINS